MWEGFRLVGCTSWRPVSLVATQPVARHLGVPTEKISSSWRLKEDALVLTSTINEARVLWAWRFLGRVPWKSIFAIVSVQIRRYLIKSNSVWLNHDHVSAAPWLSQAARQSLGNHLSLPTGDHDIHTWGFEVNTFVWRSGLYKACWRHSSIL